MLGELLLQGARPREEAPALGRPLHRRDGGLGAGERPGDDAVSAAPDRGGGALVVAERHHEHDLDLGVVPPELRQHGEPVEVGHLAVEEHGVDGAGAHQIERRGAALGGVHDEAVRHQRARQRATRRRLVVDDEDVRAARPGVTGHEPLRPRSESGPRAESAGARARSRPRDDAGAASVVLLAAPMAGE